VKVPYVGVASKAVVERLSQLVDQEFDLKLCAVYVTDKVSRYFQLKSGTPMLSAPMSFTNLRVCVIQTLPT